MVVGEIRGLR